MSISQLPQSTVRLLGSSILIVSPLSIVKELVDNSIDANATSIEILIAPNTIDKIQVRDNGLGIGPGDFDALGRRAHTRKLRSFEELQVKAGRTQGFRGEALASLHVVSEVTITTRTEQDPVATLLHLRQGGGVASQQRVSAPVGTTVLVTGLFDKIPVRRQLTQKESQKSLANIKDMLQAYAMARPQIRLSCKIIGSSVSSWSYAPRTGADVKEAVMQIFGADLASHSKSETDFFVLHATLAKPDADSSKITGKGYFVSVDSRPVTAARGTMKKIVAMYKSYLSQCLSPAGSSRSLHTPFIQLNIQCIPGSYDPNVTPAKDEVLFGNEQQLLDAFESLCKEVYNISQEQNIIIPNERQTINSDAETDTDLVQVSSAEDEGTVNFVGNSPRFDALSPKPQDSSFGSESGIDEFFAEEIFPYVPDNIEPASNAETQEELLISSSLPDIAELDDHVATRADSRELDNASAQHPPSLRRLGARSSTQHEDSPTGSKPSSLRTTWKVDMSRTRTNSSDAGKVPIVLTLGPGATQDLQSAQNERARKETANPWSIARMNAGSKDKRSLTQAAPQRHPMTEEEDILSLDLTTHGTRRTPERIRPNTSASDMAAANDGDDFDPPIVQHPALPRGDLDVPRLRRGLSVGGETRLRPSSPAGDIPSPMTQSRICHGIQSTPQRTPAFRNGLALQTPPLSSGQKERPKTYERRPAMARTRIIPEEAVDEHRRKPSGSTQSTSDGMRQTRLTLDGSTDTRQRRRERGLDDQIESSRLESTNLKLMEAFEAAADHRRHAVAARQLSRLRSAALSEAQSDVRRQSTGSNNEECSNGDDDRPALATGPLTTPFPDGDPRRYLIKRQRSVAKDAADRKTRKRLKSDRLPLETLTENTSDGVYLQAMGFDHDDLWQQVDSLKHCDTYVMNGVFESAFPKELSEIEDVEQRCQRVVTAWVDSELGTEFGLQINLRTLFKGKATDTGRP